MAAAGLGAALVAGAPAARERGPESINLRSTVVALAVDGSRVAYALAIDKVFVWNLRTGRTTRVSGRQSLDAAYISEIAIAGSRVVWHTNSFGNSEADDYLYASSLPGPKERLVGSEARYGDACGAAEGPGPCVGTSIGGLVASGDRILVGRWTTDTTGSTSRSGLYRLKGARFAPFADGSGVIAAAAADSKRVALLHPDGTIAVYSAAGAALSSVTPGFQVEGVALSRRNLVVVEPNGTLALFDTATGSPRKTFSLRGHPRQLVGRAIAVRRNIAVYSAPVRRDARGAVTRSAIRALNLATGEDRIVRRLAGQITLARFGSLGLICSVGYRGADTLVFEPLAKIVAAVS